jgi:hypothetical protein
MRILTILIVLIVSGCITPKVVDPPKTVENTNPHIKCSLSDYEKSLLQGAFFFADDPNIDSCPYVGAFVIDHGVPQLQLIGSGVLIAPTVVLTAGHIMDDSMGSVPTSFFIDKRVIPINHSITHPQYKIKIADKEMLLVDLCVVFLEEPCFIRTPELANAPILERFSPVTVCGFSYDIKKISKPDIFYYQGTYYDEIQNLKLITDFASVLPGDSGGAVLCDGKLVGIISFFVPLNGIIVENSAVRVDMYRDWVYHVMHEKN